MKNEFLHSKPMKIIEAFIFISAILSVIVANVYGAGYIKTLPLLIILGVVGDIAYKRTITTTVFGIIVSFFVIYTKEPHMSFTYNLFLSSCAGLSIAMGELIGVFIKRAINYKNIKSWILVFLVTMLSLFINMYISGDIITYTKCKDTISGYIKHNNMSEFKIVDSRYMFIPDANYTFKAYNEKTTEVSNLTIYLSDMSIVKNTSDDANIENNNTNIKQFVNNYIKGNEYISTLKDVDINIKYENLDNLIMEINKNTQGQISEADKEEFAKMVVNILRELEKTAYYADIKEVYMNINSNNVQDNISTEFFLEGYIENINNNKMEPYTYILNSYFETEYLDNN